MILSNQARCLNCGDTPFSSSVHDYRACKCGMIAVDGGDYYLRRVGNLEMIEDMSIDWPTEICSQVIEVIDRDLRRGRDAEPEAVNILVDGLTAVALHQLARRGIYYELPKTLTEVIHLCEAMTAGCLWAVQSGRNGRGVLSAIARYGRDAGAEWFVGTPPIVPILNEKGPLSE